MAVGPASGLVYPRGYIPAGATGQVAPAKAARFARPAALPFRRWWHWNAIHLYEAALTTLLVTCLDLCRVLWSSRKAERVLTRRQYEPL